MNQRSRQNLLKPWQHYRFVLGALDQKKAQANGLNLVPIFLCVDAQDQRRTETSADLHPLGLRPLDLDVGRLGWFKLLVA